MAFGNATIGDLKKIVGGGGGGGTSDYSQLSNKPSINGVTLSGNKTSEDLNISGVTHELIYSGDTLSQTLQLSESWSDYDALYILVEDDSSGNAFLISSVYLKDELATDSRIGASTDAGYIWYSITNSTTLSFVAGSSGYYIKAIRGIKFSSR